MASTPIIRYYDHLRLVYEVRVADAGVAPRHARAKAATTRSSNDADRPRRANRNRIRPHKDGGSRVDPPQQSGTPARETIPITWKLPLRFRDRPAHSGGSTQDGTCSLGRLRNGTTGKEHSMDCVNHSGVNCNRLLPELRQGTLRELRAQRGGRADSVRTLLRRRGRAISSRLSRRQRARPIRRPPRCWD